MKKPRIVNTPPAPIAPTIGELIEFRRQGHSPAIKEIVIKLSIQKGISRVRHRASFRFEGWDQETKKFLIALYQSYQNQIDTVRVQVYADNLYQPMLSGSLGSQAPLLWI